MSLNIYSDIYFERCKVANSSRDVVLDYDLNIKNEIMFVADVLLKNRQNAKRSLQQTIDNYSSDEDSCTNSSKPNKYDGQKDNIINANNTDEVSQFSSELLSIEEENSLDKEAMYTNQEYARACMVRFFVIKPLSTKCSNFHEVHIGSISGVIPYIDECDLLHVYGTSNQPIQFRLCRKLLAIHCSFSLFRSSR